MGVSPRGVSLFVSLFLPSILFCFVLPEHLGEGLNPPKAPLAYAYAHMNIPWFEPYVRTDLKDRLCNACKITVLQELSDRPIHHPPPPDVDISMVSPHAPGIQSVQCSMLPLPVAK